MSVKKRSETERAGRSDGTRKPSASANPGKKNRSSELGRALRSVYDDTLRESVPDEFLSLMGKLD